MHRFLFALAGLLLVAVTPRADAFEIRNCGPQASEGMRMAAGFITRHMSTIVDDC